MTNLENVVVIGAGQAAASFAARLRQKNQDCAITIIGEETHLPYQRPPLSKKYATGEMTADQLLLRPPDWYEHNKVTCLTGVKVQSIDSEKKLIETDDGKTLKWSKLVFATGSRPRALPEALGGSLPGVYLLRSLHDADLVASELVPGKKVVIIGGGYIGLEAAAICSSRGLSVNLIEAAERILQRVACPETSNWFRALHQKNGVVFP